jgi:hypothetical protein
VVPSFARRRPSFAGAISSLDRSRAIFVRRRPFEGNPFASEGRSHPFEGNRHPSFAGAISPLVRSRASFARRRLFEGNRAASEGRSFPFEGGSPAFEGKGPASEGNGPAFEGNGPASGGVRRPSDVSWRPCEHPCGATLARRCPTFVSGPTNCPTCRPAPVRRCAAARRGYRTVRLAVWSLTPPAPRPDS